MDWPAIEQTLREVARVLTLGGQLLIVGLEPGLWGRISMPSSMHGGYWGTAQWSRWRETPRAAGVEIVESWRRPATVSLLATVRPGAGSARR